MLSDIEIIRSKRRSIAIEIRPDLRVVVRAPRRMRDAEIACFLEQKAAWIETHTARMRQRVAVWEEKRLSPFSDAELAALTEQARAVFSERAAHFAPLVGVTFGRMTVRHQKSRWGSCSATGNLSFNCLLMLCPPTVQDYVVVHELCHRLEWNHSPRFWAEVERVLPDYPAARAWLKENGELLIGRLRAHG